MEAYELVYKLLHRGLKIEAEYVADHYDGDTELEADDVASIIGDLVASAAE